MDDMRRWLESASQLCNDLLPEGFDPVRDIAGLSPNEHVRIVTEQAEWVNAALLALAVAPDVHAARALVARLPGEAIIALFSRWAHYQAGWQRLAQTADAASHWVPPHQVWRAVPLAMADDRPRATEIAMRIWPEAEAAFPALH